MVENPAATDTTTTTDADDGESITVEMKIGSPIFYTDGIAEVEWEWNRTGGTGAIVYTVELRQGGSVLDSQSESGAFGRGTVDGSGTLSGPATGGQPVSVVLVNQGVDVLTLSAPLPAEPIQRGFALDVEMLSEPPYSERGGGDNPPRYRVSVTNNDPGVSPPAEVDLRYPTGPGRFGPKYASKTLTVGLFETESFEVTYTGGVTRRYDDERLVEVRRIRDGSGTRVTDQSFELTAPVTIGRLRFTPEPGDVSLSGGVSDISLTPGGFGYTGPGGEIPQTTQVEAANISELYGIPYRLVVRAENVDRGEEVVGVDLTGSLSNGSDIYPRSDYSIPWPQSWTLPFGLRVVRELYLLDQPRVDPDTPFVTHTTEKKVPPKDDSSGGSGTKPDRDPEPDPPVTQPVIPTLSIECAFGGAQITAGESVTIPATVTTGSGQGEATGTVTFELADATTTEPVTLGPNSSTTVEATFEVTAPGSYTPEVTVE